MVGVRVDTKPKRYVDDRQARKYWLVSFRKIRYSSITGLKILSPPSYFVYQMILGSIYRRFSRQSKLRSCLVSHGESLIFPSSFIFKSDLLPENKQGR